MRLSNGSHVVQSQAEALDVVPVSRRYAMKPFKNAALMFWGDAYASVFHGQNPSFRRGTESQADMNVRRGIS